MYARAVMHAARRVRRRVNAVAARRADARRRGVPRGGDSEHLLGVRARVHGDGGRLERLARGRVSRDELRAEVRGVLFDHPVALHDAVEARVKRVQLLKQARVLLGERVNLRLKLAEVRLLPPARTARGLAVGQHAADPER